MKKKKSLFKNSLWNILAVVITAIAGFLIIPVIISEIGAENFGVYSIILMIGGFAALQGLGLGEATLKYVSYYHSKSDIIGVNRVLGSTLLIYIFSGLIISGVIIVFSADIIQVFKISLENEENASRALRIAGVAFLFSVFASVFRSIAEAIQRYDILSKYNIFMMVIRYSGMYIVAIKGFGIIGLTSLILVSGLVDIVFFVFIAHKLIPGIMFLPRYQVEGIKEVFSYGIFSFINDLIQKAAIYIDQIILGMFFSAASVAYLSAPKDLITKAQKLIGAAGQPLFPRFSSMEEGVEMKNLYVTSIWLLTIFSTIIFIPLAIVLPVFLSKWISPEFAMKSSSFAQLYSLGVSFNGGVIVYSSLLKGTGRIRWLTNIISSLTILSGLITAILVYKYGIIGSGIRILFFSWVGTGLCLYVGKRIFHDFKLIRVMFETSILPIATSLIVFFLGKMVLDLFVISTWSGIVFYYICMFGSLFILSIGSNLLIFGSSGMAFIFQKKIREFYRLRKRHKKK